MTEPDREHTPEPAEGADRPGGEQASGRTPHPEQPAEGEDTGPAGGDARRD